MPLTGIVKTFQIWSTKRYLYRYLFVLSAYRWFNEGCFGHWVIAHGEIIVWWSLKQIIAVSSVRQLKCPMPKCQLPMPKTTFIESAIYPPGDVYTSLSPCLYFVCFTRKRKSPLSPRSGQIQISFRKIPTKKVQLHHGTVFIWKVPSWVFHRFKSYIDK